MENKLQIFENPEFGKIRTILIEGQPWCVLKDVCSALGIRNHKMTAQRLDGDEVSLTDLIDSVGRSQKTTIISESGLYAVILRSDKPNAKAFRKWVTSEVLPSIRKHGVYVTDEILRQLRESEEFAESLVERLVAEKEKQGVLLEKQEELLDHMERLAPKARYFDTILRCPQAVQVSIIAKDYGMSAVKFNKLLRKMGVQYKVGNTWLLYQKYANNGFTITNTYAVNGRVASIHTCWTQRGRFWLYEMLKANGYMPEIESDAA